MNMINVGVCVELFESTDLSEKLDTIKAAGFKYVELVVWDMDKLTVDYAKSTKAELDKRGLTCTEVWCGWLRPAVWDFKYGPSVLGLVPPEYRVARMLNMLAGGVFAEALGVDKVVTHVGFIPLNPADPNYVGLIATLKHIASEYQKRGVSLLFETGQEPPVVALRTIEDIGMPNVGINLDPANLLMYGNGNPIDAVTMLAPYIKSVHAKDGEYPTSGHELGVEKPIGQGSVNFERFLERLVKVGFDGTISIEHEMGGTSPEQRMKEITDARDYLVSLIG
ncbi:hexulose-6-phosphate isomerase [Clostridia bacterium]|nr:hexulose-6-phosphate isomerase [Clostridia bacterium]